MTQINNIIRLGELVVPPAREASTHVRGHDAAAPDRGPNGPGPSAESDPSNVIAFTRLRRDTFGEDAAAKFALGGAERLAPELGSSGLRARMAGVLLCSALVHAGLLAALDREPTPMASIGLEAISVEIVLGAPTDAEPSTTPTETQSTMPIPPPVDPQQPAVAPETQEAALAPHDAKPIEPAQPPAQEDLGAPAQPTIEPKQTDPVAVAPPPRQAVPTEPEPERAVEPKKPVDQPAAPKPPKPAMRDTTANREQRPAANDARANNRRVATAPTASAPSPGRSDADSNYRGLAATHLARFKQFPPEARNRGDQGSSLVTFSIDGSGRVTKVALVRGTGIASLDQEAQAMVRRASPFPPPPSGHPVTITAPVNFHLR